MKKYLVLLGLLILPLLFVGGCGLSIPTGTRTTTTSDVDSNGKVTQQTVVEETNVAQDALSPEMARMQQACYESFENQFTVPDNVAAQMDARASENYLMVREIRLTVQVMQGFDPRQVCASPKSIYDYAIVHDQELFATIRSGIRDVKDAAVSATPWLMVANIAKTGIEKAGNTTSLQVEAGGDASLSDVDNNKPISTPGAGSFVQQEEGTDRSATAEGEGASATGADGLETQQPATTLTESHDTSTDVL